MFRASSVVLESLQETSNLSACCHVIFSASRSEVHRVSYRVPPYLSHESWRRGGGWRLNDSAGFVAFRQTRSFSAFRETAVAKFSRECCVQLFARLLCIRFYENTFIIRDLTRTLSPHIHEKAVLSFHANFVSVFQYLHGLCLAFGIR